MCTPGIPDPSCVIWFSNLFSSFDREYGFVFYLSIFNVNWWSLINIIQHNIHTALLLFLCTLPLLCFRLMYNLCCLEFSKINIPTISAFTSWNPAEEYFQCKPFRYMYRHYRKISNIRRTKSPILNIRRLVWQLSLPNSMKPGVKSRMKM